MDKKTRLIFVGQSLKVGGIERALVEQVNALDKNKYDVDLLLFYKGGEYLQEVSPSVRLLTTNALLSSMAMTNSEAKQHVWSFFIRSIMYLLSKVMGNRILYYWVFRFMKSLGEYDVAISYFHDGNVKGLYYGCNLFVAEKVKAKKKIAWIHSDCMLMNAGSPENREMYNRFDVVVNVSAAMKGKFDKLCIVDAGRSKLVYNRFNTCGVEGRALEFEVRRRKACYTLVTVGRLEAYKSTMELLDIAKRLMFNGIKYTWYFVGAGCASEQARQYITENGMSANVVLTGQLPNPYPYIKHADLLVSGSISETFGLSILEALILNTPVVAYRYDAIDEVIANGVNGLVTDSFEELYWMINRLLTKNDELESLRKKTRPLMDYNNLNEEQISDILQYAE